MNVNNYRNSKSNMIKEMAAMVTSKNHSLRKKSTTNLNNCFI
jgi:hypothetical protein